MIDIESNLTNRQSEVLALRMKGLMAKQIAWALSISTRTVEIHMGKINQAVQDSGYIWVPALIKKPEGGVGNA